MKGRALAIFTMVLITAACATEAGEPDPTDPVPDPSSTTEAPPTVDAGQAEEAPSSTTIPKQSPQSVPAERIGPPDVEPGADRVIGEVPEEFLEPVRTDAAGRLAVEVGSLQVVRAQSMVWNDGSLGCPEPGMSYTQALVSGYWVEVQGAGRTLDYRLNDSGFFVLCESAVPQAPNQ